MNSSLLPGLPADLILAAYAAAPGKEMGSGKFDSPESSTALVANTFGFFMDRMADLPPLGVELEKPWSPTGFLLEGVARFPWAGGRPPCLDVLITTGTQLVGVESKRYEPYRTRPEGPLSDAYWRPVWGDRMKGYEAVRDALNEGSLLLLHLDAAQLIKHAFGLRTMAAASSHPRGLQPVLVYLHAEPNRWPDGRPVTLSDIRRHRQEVQAFAEMVKGDEVLFRFITYREMLRAWDACRSEAVRAHVEAVRQHYRL